MFFVLLAVNEKKSDILSLCVKNFVQGICDISGDLHIGFALCSRVPIILPPTAASKVNLPDFTFDDQNILQALYGCMPMITKQTRILLFSDGHFNETGFIKIINRAYAIAIGNYNYQSLYAFTKSEDRIFMPWDAVFLAGVLL